MKRKKTNSKAKPKSNAASRKRVSVRPGNVREQRFDKLDKRVHKIERWHKILSPQFPDIDPHDLDLIIESLLRTRKERMEVMLLKRREDGVYVF